jgi:general secretion pathway protein G
MRKKGAFKMPAFNKGRRNNNRRRGAAGFTLMEVLLVLVILVVLASMAVNVFWGQQERADKNAAKTQVGLYSRAMDQYRLDMKRYPSNLQELIDKPSDAAAANRWSGPYMSKIAKDPWDREYKYVSPGKHNPDSFDMWSAGPDGQDGSQDDIGNWDNI